MIKKLEVPHKRQDAITFPVIRQFRDSDGVIVLFVKHDMGIVIKEGSYCDQVEGYFGEFLTLSSDDWIRIDADLRIEG